MLALLCLLSNAANEIVLGAVIAALLPPFQPSLTVTSREDLGERDVRRLGTAAGLSFLWTPFTSPSKSSPQTALRTSRPTARAAG